MAAWGPGPFDAHVALDYLEGLTLRHADVDGSLDVVPGSVDHAAVLERLAHELRSAADGVTFACYGFPHSTYAAAGLVAARLTGAHRRPVPSLAPRHVRDRLGLGAHAGHTVLLTARHALELQPAARAAARVLTAPSVWADEPDATVHLLAATKQLATLLGRTYVAGPVAARRPDRPRWGRVLLRRP
ncbi:hypothetical protein [Cellulomonas fimi]|uniref:hypothetical protein n=1 Tax=Cellulomonas fimi TaxID=1708 RepID=UPI0003088F7E|nr:hypothetical protein [Cellulomonas fimi]NNH09230.1 hypothetical protein [Cellulomonas fimi]VEH30824.1 Uncharacterised protein [Cellulomonas fimi]